MKLKSSWLWLLGLISTSVLADVDLKKLMKVEPANSSKCVEFYLYKNEIYCSSEPLLLGQKKIDIEQSEHINIVFDDRVWKPAYAEDKGDISTIEYIPANQDTRNWQELITTQYIPNIPANVTLKDFVDLEIKFLKADSPKVETKILEDNGDSLVFEFSMLEPANNQQNEIQYLRKQGNSLYVLHYVKRTSNMGDTLRQGWITRFKSSTIKKQ